MTEKAALSALQRILKQYTVGSTLHLLAEAHRKHVQLAGQADDPVMEGRAEVVDHVLFCVGVGLDSVLAGSGA